MTGNVDRIRGLAPGALALGLVVFAASLTPSLVPRGTMVQGALGGVLVAAGYALGRGLGFGWRWLDLPPPPRDAARFALGLAAGIAAYALVLSRGWQAELRALWHMPPEPDFARLQVALIALAVFAVLLVLGRGFAAVTRRTARLLSRLLPPRIAAAGGLTLALLLAVTLVDGVLLRTALRMADVSSRAADMLIAPDLPRPADPAQPGSDASLIAWEDMGRWGRPFVANAPTAAEIGAFWGAPAQDPLRVYVGLTAADSAEERARLAFEELRRAGGFDRSVLVIAMPTGSGWLDPGAQDSLDFLHRGDTATVAVQYSYLSSWVSVIADPTYGLQEAQALFDLVYAHWTTLPPDNRPALYLHGLSLGAFLSQSTVPLLDVLGDPFQGAMWAGSPFLSEFWRMVVVRRTPDSPAWRPVFGNGSLIRSMSQDGPHAAPQAAWGPIRLMFLQYASDPIVFFDTDLAWRRPDWLDTPRGPDVSPQMRWIPVVTMLQVGFDMMVALGVPGYGHDYVAEHYIPAWAAVTDPPGWTPDRDAALRALFRDRPVR